MNDTRSSPPPDFRLRTSGLRVLLAPLTARGRPLAGHPSRAQRRPPLVRRGARPRRRGRPGLRRRPAPRGAGGAAVMPRPLANLFNVLEQEAREGDAYDGRNYFGSDVVRMAMAWARENALDEAASVVLGSLPDPSAGDVARLIVERRESRPSPARSWEGRANEPGGTLSRPLPRNAAHEKRRPHDAQQGLLRPLGVAPVDHPRARRLHLVGLRPRRPASGPSPRSSHDGFELTRLHAETAFIRGAKTGERSTPSSPA